MKPRVYQREAVDSIYNFDFKKGNPIISAATGSGKSVMIGIFCTEVVQTWPEQRILQLTHVKELLEQNEKAVKRIWPEASVGVISAGLGRKEYGKSITIAGIQSVYKNHEEIGHIDLIIVDECHLMSDNQGSMYQTLVDNLKEINPKLKVIGFSATPYRTKGGCLTNTKLFDSIAYEIGIKELVDMGYLTEVISKWGLNQADLKGVKKTGGEFNIKQMSERFDDELMASAIDDCLRLAHDRKKWMVFCANVDHAERTTAALRAAGVAATCVVGSTPKAEREQRLKDFSDGKYKALVNCGVLTTGYDEPQVDCIVLLRATTSAGLYVQIIGRGMRLFDGKENCLVLDFGGNIERFGVIDKIKVKQGAKRDGIVVTPMKACENPNCRASNVVQARTCHECGTPFTFEEGSRHEATAAGGALLSGQTKEPEWFNVSSVGYSLHKKRSNGSRTLKVRYSISMMHSVEEYWCIEHKGYARNKAIEWYRRVSGEEDCPLTIEGVLSQAVKFKAPKKILVKQEGKYERVIDYEF